MKGDRDLLEISRFIWKTIQDNAVVTRSCLWTTTETSYVSYPTA